jgi:hypothetical protein
MAETYIMHEGQLCRRVESFEPVDVAQLQYKVDQDAEVLRQRTAERDSLNQQLEDKELEVEDAEAALEDSKSNLTVAQTLVGESGDDEDGAETETADGTSGAYAYNVPEPVL